MLLTLQEIVAIGLIMSLLNNFNQHTFRSILKIMLCQKHPFLHQLTQNMMIDCSLNDEFITYKKTTSSVHVAYIKLFVLTLKTI